MSPEKNKLNKSEQIHPMLESIKLMQINDKHHEEDEEGEDDEERGEDYELVWRDNNDKII